MKSKVVYGVFWDGQSRPPHGGRGLKYLQKQVIQIPVESPPAWGAWIEIGRWRRASGLVTSPPAWGAWIEITSKSWR